jgi:hypothetical protein
MEESGREISLEGLRKAAEITDDDSLPSERDSKLVPQEYEAALLAINATTDH